MIGCVVHLSETLAPAYIVDRLTDVLPQEWENKLAREEDGMKYRYNIRICRLTKIKFIANSRKYLMKKTNSHISLNMENG